MVHSSGRFKTAHTGCNLSAKAYGEVHRFETALYGALFRGQSKKRYLHAGLKINLKQVKCYVFSSLGGTRAEPIFPRRYVKALAEAAAQVTGSRRQA